MQRRGVVTIETKIEDIISFMGEKKRLRNVLYSSSVWRSGKIFHFFLFYRIKRSPLHHFKFPPFPTRFNNSHWDDARNVSFFPRSGKEEYFEHISTNKNNLKRREYFN